MDIYKAIKMEKKSLKRFYRLMIILFIGLPLSVYLTGVKSIFYLVYLLIIELLIIAAVINKLNYYSLKYNYNANKLNITNGLFANNSLILCDKVVLVHTEKMESDAEDERIKIAEKNHKACAADLFICFAYLLGIKLFSGDFPSYEKCYRGL